MGDVGLEGRRIHVVRTRVMVTNRPTVSEPKTAAGRRSVPLDHLVAEFRSHRKRQQEEQLAAGPAWEGSGYVFTDALGQPISPRALSVRFDALATRAAVRRVRLHDRRHSAATMLLNDGTPVHIVSAMLGHAKPSITLNVYSHVIGSGGDTAGERLPALLASHVES